jgi:hypothetical protein
MDEFWCNDSFLVNLGNVTSWNYCLGQDDILKNVTGFTVRQAWVQTPGLPVSHHT